MPKSDSAQALLRRLQKLEQAQARLGEIAARIRAQADTIPDLIKLAHAFVREGPSASTARRARPPKATRRGTAAKRAGAKRGGAKRAGAKAPSTRAKAPAKRAAVAATAKRATAPRTTASAPAARTGRVSSIRGPATRSRKRARKTPAAAVTAGRPRSS